MKKKSEYYQRKHVMLKERGKFLSVERKIPMLKDFFKGLQDFEVYPIQTKLEQKFQNKVRKYVYEKTGFGQDRCIIIVDIHGTHITASWTSKVDDFPENIEEVLKESLETLELPENF